MHKFNYYRRGFRAYMLPGNSQLSFWDDSAELNPQASTGNLGEYYMNFAGKAGYAGPHDSSGIPLLNYRGAIGIQYNPIAIAQWGLGNLSVFRDTGNPEAQRKFLLASDWLCAHLEPNACGVPVWNHHFDWEYRS